jgi:hypothetical protein
MLVSMVDRNALTPMVINPSGSTQFANAEPSNALLPIEEVQLGKAMVASLTQRLKA